jgi:hypothetical protein
MDVFLKQILDFRRQRYEPPASEGIRTMEETLAFINEVGFCLFSYIPDVELPALARVVCQDEPPDTWGWKDSLPAARQVFYGAVYHPEARWAARPGFISLSMLPARYSLAPILQFGGDRSLLRRYTGISQEAVNIADVLESEGPLPTRQLRKSTGMDGKANSTRFTRALTEAQEQFLVTKIGITSVTRANYGYVWSIFERVFPDAARQAETICEDAAAEAILRQYVQTAFAVPVGRIASMLSLDLQLLERAAARLVGQGILRIANINNVRYLYLTGLSI